MQNRFHLRKPKGLAFSARFEIRMKCQDETFQIRFVNLRESPQHEGIGAVALPLFIAMKGRLAAHDPQVRQLDQNLRPRSFATQGGQIRPEPFQG